MRVLVQYILPIGMAFSMTAACAPTPPPKIGGVRNYKATFLCDGTQMVKVSFTPFAAVLESEGASVDLTQQPAADGFLYAGGGQSLRAVGNKATWTDSKGARHQCQEHIGEKPTLAVPPR